MSVVILSGPATLPLTYHDLRCVDDLDLNAAETQSDLETLEQDVLHILEETLGSNLDDPDRGLGFATLLSGNALPLQHLASIASSQLTKDDRIDSATTTITQTGPSSFTVAVVVVVANTVIGLYYSSLAAGSLLPAPP